MPNRPKSPYGRLPLGAAIGAPLMLAAAAGFALYGTDLADWRQALATGLVTTALLLLIGPVRRTVFHLLSAPWPRITKIPSRPLQRAYDQDQPSIPGALPAPRGFDQTAFLEAALARAQPSNQEEDGPPRLPADRIRRLTFLRDHPGTPPAEREAAGQAIKRAAKSATIKPKKRTARRKKT